MWKFDVNSEDSVGQIVDNGKLWFKEKYYGSKKNFMNMPIFTYVSHFTAALGLVHLGKQEAADVVLSSLEVLQVIS